MTAKPESRPREEIDRQPTDAGLIVHDRAATSLSAEIERNDHGLRYAANKPQGGR
jgi:hypothetical protein